ncbi:MAG: alpha/beta fold hydrolase [Ostreibacterium sp.]
MAPESPRQYRDQACWIYSQAAFGIYTGDLHFYSEEFDGDEVGKVLSDTEVPIAFLTGEFHYSATADDTQKVARHIPSAYFEEMPALGHFPMTENPDYFRAYFLRALAYINA